MASTVDKLWPQDDPSVIQDTSGLEGEFKSNVSLPGLEASFARSAESGFAYKGVEKIYDSYQDKFLKKNKFLSPEEAQESPFYRPGIDVSHGISEYMLKRASDEYDRDERQQFAISQMPSGLGSTLSRASMSLIGAATDPVTIGASLLAPETIGIRAAPFLAKAASPLAKIASRSAVGAGEGLLIGSPTAVSDLMDENKYRPEEDKGAHAIADLAGFMAFGGVIRGATGFKVPITKEAAHYANQVSVHQMSEGFFPNTDLIVQQGYYEARQLPEQSTTNDLKSLINEDISGIADDDKIKEIEQNIIAPLEQLDIKGIKKPKVKSLVKQLNDARTERNRLKSSDNVNAIASERRGLNKNLSFKDARKQALAQIKKESAPFESKIKDIESKLSNMKELSKAKLLVHRLKRGVSGRIIKKEIVKNPENMRPAALLNEDALKGSVKDLDKTLDDFKKYMSEDMLRNKSHKNTAQIISETLHDMDNPSNELSSSSSKYSQLKLPSYLRGAIDTMRKSPQYRSNDEIKNLLKVLFEDERKLIKTDSRNVKTRISSTQNDAERMYLENELKNLSSRLSDVENARKTYPDMWHVKQAFDSTMLKKYDILRTLKQNEIYNLMVHGTGKPVDAQQLQANVESIMSPGNELPLNQNERSIFDTANAQTPEDLDAAYDSAMDTLNSLSNEDTATVREEMKELSTVSNSIINALQKAAKCLGGAK